MNKQYYTYIWVDTKTKIPVYVGKGLQNRNRAFDHLKCKSRLGNLLRKRQKEGFEVLPIILLADTEEDAFEMEELLIALIGRSDLGLGTLFNLTNGGDGLSGHLFSETHRAKISAANQHRIVSAETRAKIGLKSLGRIKSEESKDKISKGNSKKRPIRTDEHKKNLSLANMGRKTSDETKQKMSISRKGVPKSEETKEKMRLAALGKKRSDETREKISRARKGKSLSEDHKAKISEGLKRCKNHER
jgi:hypothetical protein